ncbi:AMP-binding protein [Haloechinothrix sp. LS1_15]|uniref:AMP-binding protein n=1 Tax=Haloechinothrix sp. LS1_15 TaxID=2652248 RepID=UPI0029471E0C|nr:AMP-binding protein [Haloechinothrix sp. LS1_15]MDV6012091.1 acetate--CoA ligase [Haloechinothrix sp. LS1_15]
MADRDVPHELARWADIADELAWARPWQRLYQPTGEYGRWFEGGRFNLAVNCVDRHLELAGERTALYWEGEPGDRRELTYRQLHGEVVRLARALRLLGVGSGDRVALHTGWLPETVVAMLACARIGAIHALFPVPLPVEALAERLDDFRPRVLITQDGAWRHGAILPLKARADEALGALGGIEHTIVVRRTGVDVSWYAGDRWLHELLAEAAAEAGSEPEPGTFDPEQPVMASHLANRRGRPVTVLHGAATLAVSSLAVHRYGIADEGVFWCAADVSWVGAQAHGVYGPLLAGAAAVMFEGTLDVPTRHRAWDIVRRYGVGTLLTTPTVARMLRGWSRRPPEATAVEHLRRIVTMAEPVEPELARWLAADVGRHRVTVADAWGQVELGGIASVDPPVAPRSLPDPGFTIVDGDGNEVPAGHRGELVLRRPWAGTLRAMEGSGAADVRQRHWHRPPVYSTHDLARRAPDGSLEFLGRMDEVVSVSGQLVSLGEVRQVLLEHPFVTAAEVVERADQRLGRSLAAVVALTGDVTADAVLAGVARELLDTVRELLGGLARPRGLAVIDRFGDELSPDALRRALALLMAGAREDPVSLTWEQVLAAAAAAQP